MGDSQKSREEYFVSLRSEAELAASRAIEATGAPPPPVSYVERTSRIASLGSGEVTGGEGDEGSGEGAGSREVV